MTDVELEELLKGLNIGSPGKASRSGGKGRGELDEVSFNLNNTDSSIYLVSSRK